MKRILTVVAISVAIVATTMTPAQAVVISEKCRTHSGWNNFKVCVNVNEHNTYHWKEANASCLTSCGGNLDGIYVDWLRLYKNGTVVQVTQGDRWVLSFSYSTDWANDDCGAQWIAGVRYRVRVGDQTSGYWTLYTNPVSPCP
jgi:hypothetical protein